MYNSQDLDKIYAAFSKAQGEFENIDKNKKGQFKYADLATILAEVRPIMKTYGLCVIQYEEYNPTEKNSVLCTKIGHESGQWFMARTPLHIFESPHNKNGYQNYGSAMSYYRRYALLAILGIKDEESDNDGGYSYENTRKQDFVIEYVSQDQLAQLEAELDGYPELAERAKKYCGVTNIRYVKKAEFMGLLKKVQKIKADEYGAK